MEEWKAKYEQLYTELQRTSTSTIDSPDPDTALTDVRTAVALTGASKQRRDSGHVSAAEWKQKCERAEAQAEHLAALVAEATAAYTRTNAALEEAHTRLRAMQDGTFDASSNFVNVSTCVYV